MPDKETFRIETGYGQTISVEQPDVGNLFVLKVEEEHWDAEGETVLSTTVIRCVLEPSIAHRLAVALYHGVSDSQVPN